MIKIASFLGLIGLFLATGVIVWSGYDQVLLALQKAGMGIVWTSLFHLVPMLACVLGWHALLGRAAPSRGFFFYALWIRASINNLLPVAHVGGEIVSVRMLIKKGVRKGPSIACTVIETTVSIIGQFVFVLLGVGLFALHVSNADLFIQLGLGLVLSLGGIAGFLFVQKIGVFGLIDKLFAKLLRDKWKKFAGGTARLDRALHTMYKRAGRVFFCGVMQFFSWGLCSVEIWLALHFLGHPIPLLEAVMLEALIEAMGSAAFLVPGAIGVQEAGFLLFGNLMGLTPEVATALAVIRRCRDLILYVPGLLAWQIQEGRWLFQKKNGLIS